MKCLNLAEVEIFSYRGAQKLREISGRTNSYLPNVITVTTHILNQKFTSLKVTFQTHGVSKNQYAIVRLIAS